MCVTFTIKPWRVAFGSDRFLDCDVIDCVFFAVGEEQISSIGRGLCVLLGISVEDSQKDAEYM